MLCRSPFFNQCSLYSAVVTLPPATSGPDAGVGCLDLMLICFPATRQALIAEARAGDDGAELQGGDVS
ncbi:uncharacterized [Tachysurus ichikawai]